ncbi:MAG: hypothetical protein KatS3mg054_1000 [Chloroflexus sp.]|nr:MAG: hypothetical protein KatS3mg054_1000 [Chloroflexus sp.]
MRIELTGPKIVTITHVVPVTSTVIVRHATDSGHGQMSKHDFCTSNHATHTSLHVNDCQSSRYV